MAERTVVYRDINQTLRAIREQVVDSIDYCDSEFQKYSSPKSLFKSLSLITTYHDDPPGIELLQSSPSLFLNNYWGVPGAGDCDCFTILVLAVCIVNGWNENEIILAGRNKKTPVHIYSTTTVNGERYILDLTNPYINVERPYAFKQVIPV